MPDIGSVLGGRYRLVELLGQGGMATIYRARDSQLERDVAVKVLRPEYGADPDFLARFRHEAQSAASLNHPGIVAVYDYGTDPVGPFIVMELVDGEDLATLLRRRGKLSPAQAARVVSQVARALAVAHQRGFVHRDVKPGNVLVTKDNRVKVADFGIARAVSESALTVPGTTLGSVHYFSPEQARGELATPASDVYSLGIVLYELLTGKRPWSGDTAAAIATARLTGDVPSPASLESAIPPAIDAIDRKALATAPDERFGSAGAMADALDRFLAGTRPVDGDAPGSVRGVGAATAAGAGGATAAVAAGAGAGVAAGAGAAGSGVARANPNARVPYSEDAFAGSRAAASSRAGRDDEVDEEPATRSPWLWISGALALAVLALAGFLVFRLVSGIGVAPPASGQVTVPDFFGSTFAEAQAIARGVGLTVEQGAFESSDQPIGTITKQDPAAGTNVAKGSAVSVTIAISAVTTTVPDLRGKVESEAVNLLAQAGLQIGTRSEAFDLFIPVGAIVSQDPGPGAAVAKGTVVNYVVSKGPEVTPTPIPTLAPPPTAPPPTAPPPPTEPPITAPPITAPPITAPPEESVAPVSTTAP